MQRANPQHATFPRDVGTKSGARQAGEAGPIGVQRAPRCDTPAEHRAR